MTQIARIWIKKKIKNPLQLCPVCSPKRCWITVNLPVDPSWNRNSKYDLGFFGHVSSNRTQKKPQLFLLMGFSPKLHQFRIYINNNNHNNEELLLAQFPWSPWLKEPRTGATRTHSHGSHAFTHSYNNTVTTTLCEAPAGLGHNLDFNFLFWRYRIVLIACIILVFYSE